MRKKAEIEPEWKRNTRTRKAFLWFPRSVRTFPDGFLGREVRDTRWLEVAEWEETVTTVAAYEAWHGGWLSGRWSRYWKTARWIDR